MYKIMHKCVSEMDRRHEKDNGEVVEPIIHFWGKSFVSSLLLPSLSFSSLSYLYNTEPVEGSGWSEEDLGSLVFSDLTTKRYLVVDIIPQGTKEKERNN